MVGPYGAAYRVSGLIVVKGRHIRLFGYERGVGPAFIRRIITALTGPVTFMPWDDVADISGGHVTVTSEAADLEQLGRLPDRRSASAER